MSKRNLNFGFARGFTLIEILVVLAIVAIVASIVFAVFGRVREKGREASCASNLRQLGLAMEIYMQDSDERRPVEAYVSRYNPVPFMTGIGWAGRLYPYVKSAGVFACPDDPTQGASAPNGERVPVSYGLNANFASAMAESSVTAPADTVLLFEVMGDQVELTKSDEGMLKPSTQMVSAAGDGEEGALTSLTETADASTAGASYATGKMDNVGDTSRLPVDQYAVSDGRHSQGANFLAADGHAKWAEASRISAGANAVAENNYQASSGCKFHGVGEPGGYFCAEGAALGTHALTFSVL